MQSPLTAAKHFDAIYAVKQPHKINTTESSVQSLSAELMLWITCHV